MIYQRMMKIDLLLALLGGYDRKLSAQLEGNDDQIL